MLTLKVCVKFVLSFIVLQFVQNNDYKAPIKLHLGRKSNIFVSTVNPH